MTDMVIPPEGSAFEALLSSPTEQFDKRSEILASIDAYSKAVPATASATPPPPAAVFRSDVEVKALVETTARLGRELGRREAAEEIAAKADEIAEGYQRSAVAHRDLAGDKSTGKQMLHHRTAIAFRNKADGAWAVAHAAREIGDHP